MRGRAFLERDCVLRSGATKNQPQHARINQRALLISNALRLVGGPTTAALRPNGGVPLAETPNWMNNVGVVKSNEMDREILDFI